MRAFLFVKLRFLQTTKPGKVGYLGQLLYWVVILSP